MPKLRDVDFTEADFYPTAEDFDVQAIKDQVSLAQVIVHFGEKITPSGKTRCLWHNDKTPSLHLYTNTAFCFACRSRIDVIDYVRQKLGCGFMDALRWLVENMALLPSEIKRGGYPTHSEYRGPVPPHWVSYWHRELTPERRQGLYERGLKDWLIDSQRIGWRPDYGAYAIPFWHGAPGASEIEIIQYRATDLSPEWLQRRRYSGHKYYYKPSVVGRCLINPYMVIILFGSFDALLGRQDGLPVLSTNGSAVFIDTRRAEAQWFHHQLRETAQVFVVPDNTTTEHDQAQQLAEWVGGEVAYFHVNMAGKDYTDYRLAGGTPQQFYKEVLGVSEAVFLLDEASVEDARNMIVAMARGQKEVAVTIHECLMVRDYKPQQVAHTYQLLCGQALDPTFSLNEWDQLSDQFCEAQFDWLDIAEIIVQGANTANQRRGGF